ncbi:hypothetical protein TWF730_000768 [Orbilia blumenaviensis]|uniref:ubiquitinyl hydrolase 1 n=1 Tax=Orbilia blumenaviensis TaxID=1796055 RepID=A0AAV9VNN5_9PEZI
MSLKVLLSQPILFVPESTTQTTHAPGASVSVPVPPRFSPDSEQKCVSALSSLLSTFQESRASATALSSPLSSAKSLSPPRTPVRAPSSEASAIALSSPLSSLRSITPPVSPVPVRRSPAIALSGPQGKANASTVRAPSSQSSASASSTSTFLSSSSAGRSGSYETSPSVPKKRDYEATALSQSHDGERAAKRRKVSLDAREGIPDPAIQARGFKNSSGVHCYRNASLQALGHIPAFREKIRKHKCSRAGCIACVLRVAFREHFARHGARLPSHEPRGLQAISRSLGPKFAEGRQQEDAQEYIGLLLDRLAERCDPGSSIKRAIPKIFGASKISEVECVACEKVTTSKSTDDLLVMLNLPQGQKRQRISLEDCLEEYTKEEVIRDYRCEACRCCGIKKRVRFTTPPKVALMALSRFDFMGRRDNREVSFPEKLNWNSYTKGWTGSSELTAVISHVSTKASSGHYTAFLNAGGGQWLQYDDGRVSTCRSPTKSQLSRAYLLLYSQL